MNSYLCTDPVMKSHLARVENIGEKLGNRDSYTEEYAARNLMNRQPAFLTTAKYHNARAGIVVDEANRLCRLDTDRIRSLATIDLLDTLIPLNEPAITELVKAYGELGTFRQRHELRRRAERIEGVSGEEFAA